MSDLLFKTIIFHVTPYGPQVSTQGFSELSVGGGGGGGGEGGWCKMACGGGGSFQHYTS